MPDSEFAPILYYRKIKSYKYENDRVRSFVLPKIFWPTSSIVVRGHCGETLNSDTVFLSLDTTGILRVYRAYKWDGPSGPAVDTPAFMRGSMAHDALYQMIRMGFLDIDKHRLPADDFLGEICKQDGMWWIRRRLVMRACKIFARKAASRDADSEYGKLVIAP